MISDRPRAIARGCRAALAGIALCMTGAGVTLCVAGTGVALCATGAALAQPATSPKSAVPSITLSDPAPDQTLVFLDNDFSGPGETNIQALYPALSDPGARLLGIGVVTGDAWRDEGVAHLLAFLDRAGCRGIPVSPGAVTPLLRTRGEMSAWEAAYGPILWKGAWQPASARHETGHPDDPSLIPPMPEGPTPALPQGKSAARAMIAAVHRYPGRVTIVAAGPLTDIALAIRLDASFARLARGLVFMGGLLDIDHPQIAVEKQHAIDFYTDFNMIFDPEAAHIALTASWRHITNMGDVTLTVPLTPALRDVAKAGTMPLAAYFAQYARTGIPMWDEVTMAVALHPDLITSSVEATMDVETARGMFYGRARARAPSLSASGMPPVTIVTGVDQARFMRLFAESFHMQAYCPR